MKASLWNWVRQWWSLAVAALILSMYSLGVLVAGIPFAYRKTFQSTDPGTWFLGHAPSWWLSLPGGRLLVVALTIVILAILSIGIVGAIRRRAWSRIPFSVVALFMLADTYNYYQATRSVEWVALAASLFCLVSLWRLGAGERFIDAPQTPHAHAIRRARSLGWIAIAMASVLVLLYAPFEFWADLRRLDLVIGGILGVAGVWAIGWALRQERQAT